ncbi:hypothetical protein F4820DRAFT_151811 [Hypoxylon rubiginosum]|uniref:Uncharacterized protein n=1 Tax=Hypoxylon rubiginosum TaxID=110542 RepID=A0ACB9ZBL5_9PEZI|nr:hypothetical protein F4820DRAFT_151811 [Hypoxylon rubiginosum]
MSGGPEPRSDASRHSQPGLEVAPDSGLELAHPSSSAFAEHLSPEAVPHEYYGKGTWYGPEVVSSQGCYDEAVLNSSPLPAKQESAGLEPISTLTQGKSRRRLYILIVVLVLALIGAIVGGVVGGLSRRNHDASSEESTSIPVTSVASDSPTKTVVVDSSTSSTISSTPTPTATLQSLRPNSKLAVTGWRADGGFNIRLFYQDRKDNLRFSEYSSDEDSWSSSNKVLATDVMSGTPIGVGTHVPVDPAQVELFWFNSSSELSGTNFRDGYTPLGGGWDSIDEFPVSVNIESRLAMYWPYAVMQDGDSSFRLVTYLGANPGGPWNNRSLGISGPGGTGMAIVPRTSTCASPCTAGLVYRGGDGRLAGYLVQESLPLLDWGFDTPNTLPEETAVAAFAVAKPNDPNDGTNVYVLYQNGDNDIELWAYDNGAWKGNSPALKGADVGTDITCVTEAVWENANIISSQYDMSRCYFLSGGQIREVLYNGTGWEVLGNIPLS